MCLHVFKSIIYLNTMKIWILQIIRNTPTVYLCVPWDLSLPFAAFKPPHNWKITAAKKIQQHIYRHTTKEKKQSFVLKKEDVFNPHISVSEQFLLAALAFCTTCKICTFVKKKSLLHKFYLNSATICVHVI